MNQRIELLNAVAQQHSLRFRRQFIGQAVEVLVEHVDDPSRPARHGRCERYFDVELESPAARAGDCVAVVIDHVTATSTKGHPR